MAALFADLPEALAATVEIAQRCAYRPKKRDPILPRFTSPDGTAVDEAAELRRQADEGLTRRIRQLGSPRPHIDDYRDRLDFELGVIER
jgi:DNA polymerase-3 subunit alpha